MKKIIYLSRFFPLSAPLLLAALFLAALPCQAEHAPKTPQIPKQRENRFLFVVDTSASMRGYSNEVVQGVVDLLKSDMRGEFREGDTIGLWTYDNKLHAEFPMQVWSKAAKNTIVTDMASFLQERRYAKSSRLEKVMPALNRVIKNSERITVIIIFDGTGVIKGTPFDRTINGLQNKYARELQLAHEPFVTVLAARDGTVFDYTINYPGLVAIPHTANPEPVETKAPVAVIANPVTNTPAIPRPTHSFIMSAAPAPAPAPVAPPTATPAPVPPPAATPVPVAPPSAVAPVPTPAPVAPVTPAPVSQPAQAAVAPPHAQPVPAPIVARQNPEPANETPAPPAPPASVTASAQQPAPAPPPVARSAPVAAIAPAGGTQLALIVIAFSLLTIAAVLVVFLVRRSRHAPQPSLITQSIDRPR